MVFENVFSNFLVNFNNFIDEKYILSDNAFVRKGKWSLETAIKFPLFNRKKTKFNEVNRYLRSQTGDNSMKITGSGVCDRMQYIDPKVYINMNDGVIIEMYDNVKEMETFNGFHVFAIDGSYVEIPNHPQAREEMGVPENNDVETFAANARISCTVDTKMDFVVSSIIDSQTVDEITLALRHLEDLKNKINMNKVITCYDRYYNSTEIMLKTETLDSYYLIRGKTNTFKKQQQKMDKSNKSDEIFDINLNNAKIKKFHDDELKKIARKQKSIQVRIVKVKLKTGQTEILFTNLPPEIATPEELKQRKMENRNRLRQIKKQIIHRKIQRKKTNHNRTRLLQPHIPTKPTNRNQTRCRTKNNKKTKRNCKIHLRIPLQHQHTHRRN